MKKLLSFGAMALAASSLSVAAADLGGDCCSDLEERVAELEATTARKGNRKMSLTVSGQLSQAVVWYDIDDMDDWSVGSNSNSPSFVQFAGAGKFATKGFFNTAGFVLQISVGDYKLCDSGYGHINDSETYGISVRQSYVYLKGEGGMLSIGRQSMATDNIMKTTHTNARHASTPIGFQPLLGDNGFGDLLSQVLGGDGGKAEGVKYSTPTIAGFTLSGFVGAANFDSNGDSDGSIWDVALRYAGEYGSIRVAGGIGYRDGVTMDDDIVFPINISVGDIQTISGSAEVQHIPSGLFLGGAAFQTDISDFGLDDKISGYSVRGGIEKKVFHAGASTLFLEYGKWDTDSLLDDDPSYFGAGVVQAIDGAAMKLYASGRKYDGGDLLDDEDLFVFMAGATVHF